MAATAQPGWKQIKQADARINAARVTWRREIFIRPRPNADVEKAAARAAEQARQEGSSPDEIQRREQVARNLAKDDVKGYHLTSTLSFIRAGATIRCDIIDNLVKAEKGTLVTHHIELYDGENSVYIPVRVNSKEVSKNGILRRDETEILSHSAATWLLPQFLIGLPLSQQTSPANPSFASHDTSLREGPNNTLVLEKKTASSRSFVGRRYPALHRLVISKEHLRPVSYENVNLLYEKEKDGVGGHVSITGYRRYADGVWFPAKVSIVTPTFTVDYTLVKAAFNEAVDPMELSLPPDTRIADSRFGFGKNTVSYKLKNGQIPSDEEVRNMLGEEQVKTQAAAKMETEATSTQTQQLSALPVTPALGLLFMALGGVLWTRSRGHTDNKPQ